MSEGVILTKCQALAIWQERLSCLKGVVVTSVICFQTYDTPSRKAESVTRNIPKISNKYWHPHQDRAKSNQRRHPYLFRRLRCVRRLDFSDSDPDSCRLLWWGWRPEVKETPLASLSLSEALPIDFLDGARWLEKSVVVYMSPYFQKEAFPNFKASPMNNIFRPQMRPSAHDGFPSPKHAIPSFGLRHIQTFTLWQYLFLGNRSTI